MYHEIHADEFKSYIMIVYFHVYLSCFYTCIIFVCIITSSCGYELSILWSTEVSRSPFAATPLITDVDGDGSPDIVAAPFTEEVQVVRAEDGQILPDSHWPFHLADRTVLASPLQVRCGYFNLYNHVSLTWKSLKSQGKHFLMKKSGKFMKNLQNHFIYLGL